jgi:chromosome segregation ATPase
MQDLAELERRITAALQRIGTGLESLTNGAGAMPVGTDNATDVAATSAEIARLQAELDAERAVTAQLRDALRALQDAGPTDPTSAEAQVEKMTRQLDVQGLEMQRMRKSLIQMRGNLRALRQAQAAGIVDPDAINRAMVAELDSVRISRLAEMAEMDEILAELDPLIGEVRVDA